MRHLCTTLLLLLAAWTFADAKSLASSAEGAVIEDLINKKYIAVNGVFGRPVSNVSTTVPVKMNVDMVKFIDLDTQNQVLTLKLWTQFSWVDEFLRWDPDSYGGVREINVPSNSIWTPDITLYNSAAPKESGPDNSLCHVLYDGDVLWVPQEFSKSTCAIDDNAVDPLKEEQTCMLKFGSWTYSGNKLDLDFSGDHQMTMDNFYNDNRMWALVGNNATRNERKYSCCPELPFIDLTYILRFKRIPTSVDPLAPIFLK